MSKTVIGYFSGVLRQNYFDLLQVLIRKVAVDNTLAEKACKLKHQTKKSGRASCKETQVGGPTETGQFFDITDFETISKNEDI